MLRLIVIVVLPLLALAQTAKAVNPYNLVCDVWGPWGERGHTIQVEDSYFKTFMNPHMRLVEQGSHDLLVESFGADEVVAFLKDQLGDWPHGATRVKYTLDRNTGAVRVEYLGPEATTQNGIRWSQVFETETGRCTKVAPSF